MNAAEGKRGAFAAALQGLRQTLSLRFKRARKPPTRHFGWQ